MFCRFDSLFAEVLVTADEDEVESDSDAAGAQPDTTIDEDDLKV